MVESPIPDRQHELEDTSYRMLQYTWFRTIGRMPGLANPHYLGRGVAFNTKYNIRDVWQAKMPEHVVMKISLSAGGAVAAGPGLPLQEVKAGSVILRFVEESTFWEGYQPGFRGRWEFIGLILAGEVAVSAAKALLNQYGRTYHLGLQHPLLRHLLQLVSEPNHITEISASSAFQLCNNLFTALLQAAESAFTDRVDQFNRAQAVEATMRQDLQHDWSVEELAELHGMSREHLTRIFSRRFGIPPRKYLVELRLQEACQLLRTSLEPVKCIVTRLGFQSHANFVRAFRRLNGMSPTEYRARQNHP